MIVIFTVILTDLWPIRDRESVSVETINRPQIYQNPKTHSTWTNSWPIGDHRKRVPYFAPEQVSHNFTVACAGQRSPKMIVIFTETKSVKKTWLQTLVTLSQFDRSQKRRIKKKDDFASSHRPWSAHWSSRTGVCRPRGWQPARDTCGWCSKITSADFGRRRRRSFAIRIPNLFTRTELRLYVYNCPYPWTICRGRVNCVYDTSPLGPRRRSRRHGISRQIYS